MYGIKQAPKEILYVIVFYLIFFTFNLILKLYLLKVYASKILSNPNSLWIVSGADKKNKSKPVIYGNRIRLRNKGVDKSMFISSKFKSPSTGNFEGTVFLIYLIICKIIPLIK